jgi:hypothetical protein
MGRFINNRGKFVNILAATNAGNNRRTAVSMRRPVNTFPFKNTSTVTLGVVGGDEMGSLKSETVKYGCESQGTRTRERLRWQGPAACTNDRSIL